MRSIGFALALMLAAVPAVQAQQAQALPADQSVAQTQQLSASVSTPAPDFRPVDAPVGIARPDAASETIDFRRAAEERTAFQDPSARNVLAIIGAVVVIVALIVLLK